MNLEQAAKTGNRARYLECRRSFYDRMIEIGGNKELARVMPLSRTDLFRAQVESIQTDRQRSRHSSGYAGIAAAIVGQDVEGADKAVKRHFDGTRQTMEELPSGAFPDDPD